MLIYFLITINLFLSTESKDNVNCTVYKEKFGEAVSSYTACAVSNSHPIKLCQTCVDKYINLLDSYKNLSQMKDKNESCYNYYVHHDRLEIIETMYQNNKELWKTAKCYECFIVNDGVLTPNRSFETAKFDELFTNAEKCMNNPYKNVSAMCNTCMPSYTKLSNFYTSISNENENIGMCMDIVDLMNSTRAFWSNKCCLYRQHKEYLFIMSACFVLLITILFYSLTKLFVDKQSPAICLQSRFAESLNHVPKR